MTVQSLSHHDQIKSLADINIDYFKARPRDPMLVQEDITAPTQDALIGQLTQLNERASWYSTQLWALPLAYLGGVSVAVGTVAKDARDLFGPTLLLSGICGLLILAHLRGVADGEKRAVENLGRIERDLKLLETVQYKPGYTKPLVLSVTVAALVLLASGVVVLARSAS